MSNKTEAYPGQITAYKIDLKAARDGLKRETLNHDIALARMLRYAADIECLRNHLSDLGLKE
jgi:hypothetical protein